MKNKKLPKYEFGTYIEDVSKNLAQNQINIANAKMQAENNPFVKGLDIFGNLAMQVGNSMMDEGISKGQGADGKGVSGFLNKNSGLFNKGLDFLQTMGNMQQFAFGNNGNLELLQYLLEGNEEGKVSGNKQPVDRKTVVDNLFKEETGVNTSDLRAIKRIQSGVTNGRFGDGYYIFYDKDQGEPGFDVNRNREFVSADAFKSSVLNTPAYNKYMKSKSFAFGGTIPSRKVEVEGDEVGETPSGELLEFKGPSHEEGGIPVSLPIGTDIFSDRISIDGKTLAQRKKTRENKERKIEGIENDDIIKKSTLERVKSNNQKEEAKDKQVQTLISFLKGQYESNLQKAAYGIDGDEDFIDGYKKSKRNSLSPADYSKVIDYKNPETFSLNLNDNKSSKEDSSFSLPNYTLGDMLSIAGNLYQSFSPMNNTLANRAGDTPNINAFKNYGQDAINKMQQSKGYLAQNRDSLLNDLQLARTSSVNRNNNSSRSVNTSRALNLATDSMINKSQSDIYSNYANQLMSIIQSEAGLYNDRDSKVMQGEYARDLADRQDRDNFYTQLGKDKLTLGEGISRTGKTLNQIKERDVTQEFLNQMFNYLQGDVYSGKITKKKK